MILFDIYDLNDTQNGINLNFGIAFDITKKFFINAQYDFIKLKKENSIPYSTFNTNINLVKLGIGLKLYQKE
jgi:opacity protein-like surface antigen